MRQKRKKWIKERIYFLAKKESNYSPLLIYWGLFHLGKKLHENSYFSKVSEKYFFNFNVVKHKLMSADPTQIQYIDHNTLNK